MNYYWRIVPALGFLLPGVALAAFNDVRLSPSSAQITAGGDTVSVNGDTATVETIVVDSGSFTVTLAAGSEISLTSASRFAITTNATGSFLSSRVCNGSESIVKLANTTGGVAQTFTITPSTTLCTSTSTTGSGGGGIVSISVSGGGGSSSSVAPTVALTPIAAATPSIAESATKLQALKSQLESLKNQSTSVAFRDLVFKRALDIGSKGKDVQDLQRLLNKLGFTVAKSGAGSPGKESQQFGPATKQAVRLFQVKYKLAKPKDPGYGFVGPKTRAKIQELAKTL